MPAKFRMSRVRFSHLRARDGVIISGLSEPRRLAVTLHHTGDPVEEAIVLTIPCEAGVTFRVLRDGEEVVHDFHGETVTVRVALEYGMSTELVVEG